MSVIDMQGKPVDKPMPYSFHEYMDEVVATFERLQAYTQKLEKRIEMLERRERRERHWWWI